MSITDVLYLGLVIATFVTFSIAIAYGDWADKSR